MLIFFMSTSWGSKKIFVSASAKLELMLANIDLNFRLLQRAWICNALEQEQFKWKLNSTQSLKSVKLISFYHEVRHMIFESAKNGHLRILISWLNAQFIFLNSGQNSVAKISYLYDNKTSSLNHWLGVVDKWPIDFRGLGS